MSRNAVFDALFALGAGASWGEGQGFAEARRRLKPWDKAPQPALYQVEPEESVDSRDGELNRRTLRANWVVYHHAGKDQAGVPAAASNDILDALEAALLPAVPGARQTLGGLAYRVFVSGTIVKVPGDLDGQAVLVMPITIILP